VAAEAAGIGRRTYYRWMKRGEQGEEPFADLRAQVHRARALARIGAEQRVRDEHPLSWLRLGPGRERKGQPGWTEAVEALPEPEPEELEAEEPGLMEAIAEALKEVGWKEDDGRQGDG
jgi:hypothetical protein